MASSRIYIKGLPPTITESEFRKHFSTSGSVVKDAKVFPHRRIGFIGYETTDDAQKAIKYFNRTFIRMSRLNVEYAKTPKDARPTEREDAKPWDGRGSVGDEAAADEDTRKRKRDSDAPDKSDPKLKEFLQVVGPKAKRRALEQEGFNKPLLADGTAANKSNVGVPDDESDGEYEEIPKTAKVSQKTLKTEDELVPQKSSRAEAMEDPDPETTLIESNKVVSDSDWARSRTTRLLGLLDEDEEAGIHSASRQTSPSSRTDKGPGKVTDTSLKYAPEESIPTPPADKADHAFAGSVSSTATDGVRTTMRLFVRNLPYDAKAEDLEREFEGFGNLENVHVTVDKKTGVGKGIGFVQFSDADSAETAMQEKDGGTFRGRLIHVLPAKAWQDTRLDDFALSKLPVWKQQGIKKRREAKAEKFSWNALYMNADAVVSSVADRLGLSKSEVLDPTSSDASIRQAHAETLVIQESKTFFTQHGVDLDAFKKKQRGDDAILVKNIPYDCSQDELRKLFEEHGELKRFLIPPSGTIAIVEFANPAQCQAAFGALAYRKIKSSMLFLEKAPKDLFTSPATISLATTSTTSQNKMNTAKSSASELREANTATVDDTGRATLYVRNLNFKTSTAQLTELFQVHEGFRSAVVKTKTDPKKPGILLSMGFGFAEFHSAQQAQQALQAIDGQDLDGHKLQIRFSHKETEVGESRRAADAATRNAGKNTKVSIKNLPFEATKKDVRALLGAYGQLRSVRVPRNTDGRARGFAFAEFVTPKEAESAMEALKHTHLLGRKLVLDFAGHDPEDAEEEIERMQQKVGAQVNSMALRKLTGGGRKKFTTQNEDEE